MATYKSIWLQIFIVFTYLHLASAQSDEVNETSVCVEYEREEITWAQCKEAMNTFVGGDISSVFTANNALWWLPVTEPELRQYCTIYEAASSAPFMSRTDASPPIERYLAEGFHDMMDYILCAEGSTGYLTAMECLGSTVVRDMVLECFQPFLNYTNVYRYEATLENDGLIDRHCSLFETYRSCRKQVFLEICGSDLADWNDEALVKYYLPYMDHASCDIIGRISIQVIILIVCSCVAFLLLAFCVWYCTSRCIPDTRERTARFFFLKRQNAKAEIKKRHLKAKEREEKEEKRRKKEREKEEKERKKVEKEAKKNKRSKGKVQTVEPITDRNPSDAPGGSPTGETPEGISIIGGSPKKLPRIPMSENLTRESPRNSRYDRDYPERNSKRDSRLPREPLDRSRDPTDRSRDYLGNSRYDRDIPMRDSKRDSRILREPVSRSGNPIDRFRVSMDRSMDRIPRSGNSLHKFQNPMHTSGNSIYRPGDSQYTREFPSRF